MEGKLKIDNPPERPYFKRNPSKVVFRSLLVSKS